VDQRLKGKQIYVLGGIRLPENTFVYSVVEVIEQLLIIKCI
jgi:hypothetical protein